MDALSCMYNRKAVVKRNAIDSTSESGEPTLSTEPPIIYSSVPCYIEPDAGKYFMAGAGKTDLDYKVMVCSLYDSDGNLLDVRKGDIVVIDNTNYQVSDTNPFYPPSIPHNEINLTGGVL